MWRQKEETLKFKFKHIMVLFPNMYGVGDFTWRIHILRGMYPE